MYPRVLRSLILAVAAFVFAGCSMPSLETPACTESKNAVREFYSFHFGNEMEPSRKNIEARSKFLTDEFKSKVNQRYTSNYDTKPADEFTLTVGDPPKTFRVAECKELSPEKTEVSVLLFWRDETRTEQREVKVEAVDKNDRWLVNNISLSE